MAEAIHCPSCSTRYRLHPGRLRPSIRRAQCFSCGEVFPLGGVVQRLLPGAPAATATFDLEEVAAALEEAPAAPPSLTLDDLEGTDVEILEKTLTNIPAPLPEPAEAAPATPPAPAAVAVEAGHDTLTGSYSSARDAISKLFAGIPDLPPVPKTPREPSSMDMEATLSALEATLGKGGATPDLPSQPDGDEPTSSGRLPQGFPSSTATMHLSQEDLRAALRTGTPEEPTEALRPSDLMTILPEPPAAPPFPAPEPAPMAPAEDAGAERLRLKIGEEIYPGLSMAQLTAWIEEGRILEHHLVARQYSENWLEAHKVPGLRPIFERLRRERSSGVLSLETPAMEIAPKKSLFGGLFGKN